MNDFKPASVLRNCCLVLGVRFGTPTRLQTTKFFASAITTLAFVVTLGDVTRFPRGKQVASYLGLIPSEHSSSDRRRLGSISKQGSTFMRTLLVESVQTVNRLDEGFRRQYQHRCHRMKRSVAKVAARKLAVRLFWMLKTNTAYPEIARIESSPRHGVVGAS